MSTQVGVRPVFARWSIIAFVLLLPFVAHAIWDYVETRRLRTRMDAIVARGEPVAQTLVFPKGPAADAERFYRAASALTVDYTAGIPPALVHDIQVAEGSGQWTPAVVEAMRGVVRAHDDALSLVDRAAPLPFDGFGGSLAVVSAVSGGLIGAERLCDARTRLRVLDGDGEGAVQSLWSTLRLMRTVPVAPQRLAVLPLLLDRARPPAEARARLAAALADLDRDDALKQQFIEQRTFMLSRRTGLVGLSGTVFLHQMNKRLDAFDELIAAAGRPAAERHAAVVAVGWFPNVNLPIDLMPAERSRALLESIVAAAERRTQTIQCARRLLAGEPVDCQF